MKLTVKDISGQDQGEVSLKFAPVPAEKGSQAVHDAVVAYMAAQRSGTACTKTMGDVAGSGKKPWRQKGTGRARAGSFASPLWRGGGVVFGPKPRDYTKKISKKTRQLALRKAMTERVNAGDVLVVSDLPLETSKTKGFLGLLAKLSLEPKVLIVTEGKNANLELACRNVQGVELTSSASLNTYQLLKHNRVLFTKGALEALDRRLHTEE